MKCKLNYENKQDVHSFMTVLHVHARVFVQTVTVLAAANANLIIPRMRMCTYTHVHTHRQTWPHIQTKPPPDAQMMYKWIGKLDRSGFVSDASWLVSLNETQSAGLMK